MAQVRKAGLGAVAHVWGLETPGPNSLLSSEDPGLNLVGTGLSQAHHFQGPASTLCLQKRKERSPGQGGEVERREC